MTSRAQMQVPSSCAMFALLACLILFSNSVDCEHSCKKGCANPENGLLKYTPGHVYEYDFESALTMSVSAGAIKEPDETGLKVVGAAKVYANGECGYTLQLSAFKLINSKESIEKKILNSIQKPISFSINNDKVSAELCASDGDTEYSLNIKRAIISLLQSNKDSIVEVDVFGQCATHTTASTVGDINIVTKVRNLNACVYREQLNSGLVTGIINEKASIQSTELLKSDYTKQVKVEQGVVKSVHLVESYNVVGAIKSDSDVQSRVVTTLKLKNQQLAPSPQSETNLKKTSIIFKRSDVYSVKNLPALQRALGEVIEYTADYIKRESALKFVELIRLMRNSNTDALLELADYPHPNKELARKVYLDALFRTNTAESARAILKKLNSLGEKEKLLAILSLNLVQNIDKDTLKESAALLGPAAINEVYLAIGNLISKYCLNSNCEHQEVEAILKKFTDGLKHCKPNTRKDEDRIVYVLKGIGNAKIASSKVIAALSECAAVGRANRVRVAALQTISAVSCDPALQKKALELLKDSNEDSEIRIEAYLAAISCPNAELANEIVDVLDSEKVNQVGGFIVSNLRSIRDSTDESRMQQRYHLGNIRGTKHFPKDFRRYSFDNEISWSLGALGFGASFDQRLIYSQNGFLPRSGRLNVTTELFGTNFNVFEASVRQENLEGLLEYYIGPKGLLNKNFDDIVKLIEINNDASDSRSKRSIADDTEKIAKKYKTYGSKSVQDLNLDLSLKLFGSEISFLSLGDNIPSSLDDLIKHFSLGFEKTKSELHDFKKEFIHHSLFLDTDLIYPTGAGVPLELSAKGFLSSKIDFGVNIDVDAILEQNWQRAKYRFKFEPSIDAHLSITLCFNGQLLSTGLRLLTSTHSATGTDVTAALINDGNGFSIDVELPREKLELIGFKVNTEFFVAEQDNAIKEIPLKSIRKHNAKQNENCFNQLEFIGLNVCFVSSNSISELNSLQQAVVDQLHIAEPISFSVYLTAQKKFNLQGTYNPHTPADTQQWQLHFSTPNSKVSHDASLALELGTRPRTFSRLTIDTIDIHLAFETGLAKDDKELVLYSKFDNNNNIKKSKIGFTKNGNEYHPIIEIQDQHGVSNKIYGYQTSGKVVVENTGDKQTRYQIQDFQITNANGKPLRVNGWIDVGTVLFDSELHIGLDKKTHLVKSNFKLQNDQYAVGIFVNNEATPENIYGGAAELTVGLHDYKLNLQAKAAKWSMDSSSNLKYTQSDTSTAVTSTKFSQDLAIKKNNKPECMFKIKFGSELNKFELSTEVSRVKKIASLDVKFQNKLRTQNDYLLEANAKFNKHFVDILSKCEANGNLNAIENVLTTSWGASLSAKGDIGNHITLQDTHVDLHGHAQLSNKQTPYDWTCKAIMTPDKGTSELKVLQGNEELVNLNAEYSKTQEKISNGKVKLLIKNFVAAESDLKLNKNGKGEFVLTVETQKIEPKQKVVVDSKFYVQAPKYGLEANINIDNAEEIVIKTENFFDKIKFSTKNLVKANDKTIAFDADGNVKGNWQSNGELQSNFALTLPNGRKLDGNIKRALTTNPKTGILQGTLDFQVNDNEPDAQKSRSLKLNSKLDRLNLKAKDIILNSQLSYIDGDNKVFDLNYNVKHRPKGNYSALDFAANAHGSLLPSPIEISVTIDQYNSKNAIGSLHTKYGNTITANLNGKYDFEDLAGPFKFEFTANAQAPKTTVKSFDVKSYGKFSKPTTTESDESYGLDFNFDGKTGNDQVLLINSKLSRSKVQSSSSLSIQSKGLGAEPISLEGSYSYEQKTDTSKSSKNQNHQSRLNLSYGDKYINSNTDISLSSDNSINLQYALDSSYKSLQQIRFELNTQESDADTLVFAAKASHSAKVYALETVIYKSSPKQGVDLKITLDSGNPIVISGIGEVFGDGKAKLILNIANLVDLDINSITELSYTSLDNLYVLSEFSSKKLKLEDYKFELHVQSKSLTVTLQNPQATVFSGTGTYSLKQEQNKEVLEGQGSITYHGKPQNSNFKLVRQIYKLNSDKEIGFSYTFNINFGTKNGVSTLKVTNKDLNVKISICEEKKQCSNAQFQSIVTTDKKDLSLVQHALLIFIDLKEIGYPYEFELQSKTIKNGLSYQYNLDSYLLSRNNLKYQLIALVQPTSSNIQLKLPKREILLETTQTIPPLGKIFGHYENSATFYIDKLNKPNEVSRISAQLDLSGVEKSSLNAKGEFKIEHPTIRTLSISGKLSASRENENVESELVFDVFKSPEQKFIVLGNLKNAQSQNGYNISLSSQVLTSEQQVQYELKAHTALNTQLKELSTSAEINAVVDGFKAGINMFGQKDRLEIITEGIDGPTFKLYVDINKEKHLTKLKSSVQVLKQSPLDLVIELLPTAAKIHVINQELIDANAEITLGKEALFNIQGSGKQLANGRIALDLPNFLQATYASSGEDIKQYLKSVEEELKKKSNGLAANVKENFSKLQQRVDHQIHIAHEIAPDFSKFVAFYQDNLIDIVKELEGDPTIAPIIQAVRIFVEKASHAFHDLLKVANDLKTKLQYSIKELHGKLNTLLKEVILPAWEQFAEAATKLAVTLQQEVIKILHESFEYILPQIKKYSSILQNYAKSLNESLKPVLDSVQELAKIMTSAYDEILFEIKAYLEKLPRLDTLLAEFNEKFEKLQLINIALNILNTIHDELQILPQTPETLEFLEKAHKYLESKLKRTPINDEQVIQELFKLLIEAIRSIYLTIETNATSNPGDIFYIDAKSWFTSLSNLVDLLYKVPALFTFRFSLINYLLHEKLDQILEINSLKSFLVFRDFQLRGHIADGHNIFTFDGQYYYYPGNCKYILTQDSVDNNFTVIAQLNGGRLKSIILTDRDGNFAEISENGALKINSNGVEYPQHTNSIHAWRKYYTIHLLSEYGVNIICTSDLKICHINVNGFYTSKLRGLLGNGNAEPYDDFIQIDGTLAANSAELGNGYAIGKCNPVAFDANLEATVPHEDICNEIFGLESPLSLGFLVLDKKPYRKACDVATQKATEKDKEGIACTIALAYGSALKVQHKFAMLPKRCLKCTGTAGQRDLGDEFSVKIPNKQADLVLVVDVNISPNILKNLVGPIISELRDTLKTRSFTDIHINLIAFNESQRYPALLTSNNGKTNFQGNLANINLDGPRNFCDNCIAQVITEKRLLDIYNALEQFLKSIIPHSDELAFKLALDYPFRAGAAKSIIAIKSTSSHGNLWKFIRAHLTGTLTKFDGALLHLIAPVQDLSLEGTPPEKLVGFNSRLVATLDGKDNKKRTKLQFQKDVGVDFVLNNGGWVFTTQHFDSLKPQDQKKVSSQIITSIADTLFKTEIASDCRCLPVHGLHAHHKCSIKSHTFVPNKKYKST